MRTNSTINTDLSNCPLCECTETVSVQAFGVPPWTLKMNLIIWWRHSQQAWNSDKCKGCYFINVNLCNTCHHIISLVIQLTVSPSVNDWYVSAYCNPDFAHNLCTTDTHLSLHTDRFNNEYFVSIMNMIWTLAIWKAREVYIVGNLRLFEGNWYISRGSIRTASGARIDFPLTLSNIDRIRSVTYG